MTEHLGEAGWLGTWATAPQAALGEPVEYHDQTLRLIVHTSIGGDSVRVRISNVHGAEPLTIEHAIVAERAAGSDVRAGTARRLSADGDRVLVVPAGGTLLTEAADLAVAPFSDLAISLYLPDRTTATTNHLLALQTSYVAAGDVAAEAGLRGAAELTSWPFVTGVDVRNPAAAGAIVVLGDSFPDGASTEPDANTRWPDLLAAQLHSPAVSAPFGVLNQGLIGNRLLSGSPADRPFHGPAGLARLERDVLTQAGVTHVIVSFGLNDLGFPGSVTAASEAVGADELIAGFRRLAARAQARGVRVIGTTVTPFEGAVSADGFHTAAKEAARRAVNEWIRGTDEFDGVADFDLAVRDPDRPSWLRAEFDAGDHMHPNDAGHRALAEAVELDLFAAAAGMRRVP